MKKILVVTLFVVMSQTLLSQNYLIIFTASGQSSIIDSIEVSNLTQKTSRTINGSDILHLLGTVSLSEETINEDKLKIYPNPMNQSARIEFENPESGLTNLLVIDNSGRIVLKHAETLVKGYQIFTISGLRSGHYSIQISNDKVNYSAQIVSADNKNSRPNLKYEGNISVNRPGNQMKSVSDLVQMQYNDGDIVLLKGFSSIYSRIITIVPTESQQVEFEFIKCIDFDNNIYPVVTIGNQTWMAENLKVTHYSNGDEIPNVPGNSQWGSLTTGAYCWNDNDISWKNAYGALYNFFAVVDSRGVCPTGWHIPSYAEWIILINELGGEFSIDGGALKSTSTVPDAHPRWELPNRCATNKSGFSGLPAGYRRSYGEFDKFGGYGYFWSSSSSSGIAWSRHLEIYSCGFHGETQFRQDGLSVRCLMD